MLCVPAAHSQTADIPDSLSSYTVLNKEIEHRHVADNDHQVISNIFRHNWFILGAAGVIHSVDSAVTDCQPNDNVEALRVFMLENKVEARPVWKPMHKQPVYKDAPAYVNGVSEAIFKVGICLPAGPCVNDDEVRYIVQCIKNAILN